jgi:hypothetical protein
MLQNAQSTDEFYVGYLPGPSGYVRFLRRIVPVLILSTIIIGGLVIQAHNNPGDGVWDIDTSRTIEGVIDTMPYAMIRVAGEGASAPMQSILLVSEGKFGALDRVKPFAGQAVRVHGTVLSRKGRRLFELADGDAAIDPLSAPDAPRAGQLNRPAPESLGTMTLRGEIIDPKCFFGAMKPGEGKAHKECATLCISGGIPPMFLTRSRDGEMRFYLLAGVDGGPVGDEILPFVADSVEVDGTVERLGDLLILKIDPTRIQRL